MAAVGLVSYGGAHQTYTMTEDSQFTTQDDQEQYINTFFCRAVYDYQTNDSSSLSFHRDDIIEVLTKLDSGWWDGLLGEERGWFPSNYVDVLSDEEAEIALAQIEELHQQNHQQQQVQMQPQQQAQQQALQQQQQHAQQLHPQQQQAHQAVADAALGGVNGAEYIPSGQHWMVDDPSLNNVSLNDVITNVPTSAATGQTQSSDFWLPEVTPDGQIFYVNTITGERSRDLPMEADDSPNGDLAGLTASQPGSSRAGSGANLGFGAGSAPATESAHAGFGVPRRSGTPEPWIRRLADDGMSYYYQNQLTGEQAWVLPESATPTRAGQEVHGRARAMTNTSVASSAVYASTSASASQSRLRADSLASQSQSQGSSAGMRDRSRSVSERVSDSEDSNMYSPAQGHSPQPLSAVTADARVQAEDLGVELTVAEKIAQSLQQSLQPPPPELISELSHRAQNSINEVISTNQQLSTLPRRSEARHILDALVEAVVVAVMNLLYISAPPSGHIPSNVLPREARHRRDTTAQQTLLKPAQRKVTATLSKLVLSARAMEYDSGPASHETPSRIESDAEELHRSIIAFVVEVQRQNQQPTGVSVKRIQGNFLPVHMGLGLYGGGAAGSWKGFGWVPLDEADDLPERVLDKEALIDLRTKTVMFDRKSEVLRNRLRGNPAEVLLHAASQEVLAVLSDVLHLVADLHIARHVDIDGIYAQSTQEATARYTQSVDSARVLVRTLESIAQNLYDDCSALFSATQHIRRPVPGDFREIEERREYFGAVLTSLRGNLGSLYDTLDALWGVGNEQADMSDVNHTGAIEWRMSRLSIFDSNFDVRRMSTTVPHDPETEDLVDMELAFGRSNRRPLNAITNATADRMSTYRSPSQLSDNTITFPHEKTGSMSKAPGWADESTSHTLVHGEDQATLNGGGGDADSVFSDEGTSSRPQRTGKSDKLAKIFGDAPPEHIVPTKPWYLRPDYGKDQIVIDPDGSVKAGTVSALVERLTTHETRDTTFMKTFLMTFRSFTTLDEVFDFLVQRFYIKPPSNLKQEELEEWQKQKQQIIQMRVLNTIKSMVQDDVLEKDEMYILDRIREFLSDEEAQKITASKTLLLAIDRAVGGEKKMTINTALSPPAPIVPKSKKLKLLDIDALELARQLTVLESHLYLKIKPMECLVRSREQKTDHNDNIAKVIQTSNRIANWVADAVLYHEDSRKRAAVLKHFISVADRCRTMHNYSSMVAIISGLNSPPIRRLKRSWEQVNARHMSQLSTCESTIDSGKNFNNYRMTLAKVAPPCVPFIGVFLTTLTFIQDGSKDILPGDLVNFRKRQKASEVIQDIQRWQSIAHNFQALSVVQNYVEEALFKFPDGSDLGDHFWNLSLEREPREREDEKMARLLQESGFL
ncbi:ras GEF [Coniophora puteana RWD-64-598 SS2]|uniref:Ras GEF n=1 Tax=Coniophora puteana (strain RWD-64-598) TaxID=741705 RepID=A0A5M3MQ37_CONPW|nr:ras GEF [Coniophora puteana RWD-64-598 SS2]EIW81292.1 ras GEF [Coniophora puteana RWD-64-598 SS2]